MVEATKKGYPHRMARARNIKPAFFKNERLSELTPHTRLLFIGLWCLADREGRLSDRPRRIKVEILPYEEVNVGQLLDILHDEGFILRYQVEGDDFIQILNFAKHQHPHHKEVASEIPAPTINDAKDNPLFGPSKRHSKSIHESSMVHPSRTNPSPSLNPLPLTLQSDSLSTKPQPVDSVDKSGEGFNKLKNGEGKPPLGPPLPYNVTLHLSDKGWEAARRAAPDWDIHELARRYNVSANGSMGRPDKPDLAFPAWCKNYTKGKRP